MKRPVSDPRKSTQEKSPVHDAPAAQTGKVHHFIDEKTGGSLIVADAIIVRLDWSSGMVFLQAADEVEAICEISQLRRAGYVDIKVGSTISARIANGTVTSISGPSTEAKGTVIWFNAERGFGFVALDGGPQAFVHSSVLIGTDLKALTPGSKLHFKVTHRNNGLEVTKIIKVENQKKIDERQEIPINKPDNEIQLNNFERKEEGHVSDDLSNPVHPGKILDKYLAENNWSVIHVAERLDVTREQIYRVLNGISGISPAMAKALARNKIGGTALDWLVLQAKFDLSKPDRPAVKKRRLSKSPKS